MVAALAVHLGDALGLRWARLRRWGRLHVASLGVSVSYLTDTIRDAWEPLELVGIGKRPRPYLLGK